MSITTQTSGAESRQFLTFLLAGETYAFDVLRTREVLTLVKLTRIPCAAPFMSGVINLRGSVVPVIDLRRKFGFPEGQVTDDTAIVIVEVMYDTEMVVIGALVDAIRAVIRIDDEHINAAPKVGMQVNADMIRALAKYHDDFVIVLDSDRVFSEEELSMVNRVMEPELAGAGVSG